MSEALSIAKAYGETFKGGVRATIAKNCGQEVMSMTLKSALANTKARHATEPKALAAVYGAASDMFNYTQRQTEAMDAAEQELQYLKDAGEPSHLIARAYRQIALSHYRRQEYEAARQLKSGIEVLGNDGTASYVSCGERTATTRKCVRGQGHLYLPQTLADARKQTSRSRRTTVYGAVARLARIKGARGEAAEALALLEKTRISCEAAGLERKRMGGSRSTRLLVLGHMKRLWRRSRSQRSFKGKSWQEAPTQGY